mmetsp:Transcript_63147/g.133300  ORF Transcript_63147/g.133300 Transcript_63147/m.133300 type:complete len:193 (+) Transcript_63147:111-689(+)
MASNAAGPADARNEPAVDSTMVDAATPSSGSGTGRRKRNPRPISKLIELCKRHPKRALMVLGGVLWLYIFRATGGDRMFFIISALAFIFGPGLSRGVASGEYSAYSIFNGGRYLLGDLRPEQIEAEQRGLGHLRQNHRDDDDDDDQPRRGGDGWGNDDVPMLRSRDANRPCPCGSGQKAKKCCFAPRSKRAR